MAPGQADPATAPVPAHRCRQDPRQPPPGRPRPRDVRIAHQEEHRRAAREPYLRATTFSVYKDVRTPIVTISDDGTLGWLITEVEVRGTHVAEDGTETPVEAIWAWIELYRKRDGQWTMVGNVSNRRPAEGD